MTNFEIFAFIYYTIILMGMASGRSLFPVTITKYEYIEITERQITTYGYIGNQPCVSITAYRTTYDQTAVN